jgi:hypothetical protein
MMTRATVIAPATKQPLTDDVKQHLRSAVLADDWATVLKDVQVYDFPGEDLFRRDVLLVGYARSLLPVRHEHWNEWTGSLLPLVGLAAPNSEGQATLFEAAMTKLGWQFDKSYEERALANALNNLREAVDRESKLTPTYAAELVHVAWRETYLANLAAVVAADPAWFFNCLISAPSLPGDEAAPERREKALTRLQRRVGSVEKLGERLQLKEVQQLWKAYAALTKVKSGQPRPQVDAVELVLAILRRVKADSSEWLMTELLARDGQQCSQCSQLPGEKKPWLPTLIDKEGGRPAGRHNPALYTLLCGRCRSLCRQRERAEKEGDYSAQGLEGSAFVGSR